MTKISFKIESCVHFKNSRIDGSFFHEECEEIIFKEIKKTEWSGDYELTCKLNNGLARDKIKSTSDKVRERILSVIIILSKSDAIASDEIYIEHEGRIEGYVSRTTLNQIKKRCSAFTIDIEGSKLKSLPEIKWDFLSRYSKTFLSISKQEKVSNLLGTIDLGGKIEIVCNHINITDRVGIRMKHYLKKFSVPESECTAICNFRNEKDHENKYIELTTEYNLEKLRSLIYLEAEQIIGIKGVNTLINLGDDFSIIYD